MNILMTGNISSQAESFAKYFSKEKHKTVIAGTDVENIAFKSVIKHEVNPSDIIFHEILSSYKFDVVIYFPTREEQINNGSEYNTGQMLDGLKNTLNLCVDNNVDNFYYISSTEVYGELENRAENQDPSPVTINGHGIYLGEKFCTHYKKKFGLKTTIIRVPHVYGPDEKSSMMYQLLTLSESDKKVVFPGNKDGFLSFLHARDVVQFISRTFDEPYSSEIKAFNLSSVDKTTFSELEKVFKKLFPKVEYSFNNQELIYTKPVPVQSAKKIFDWVSEYKVELEISNIKDKIFSEPTKKRFSLSDLDEKFSAFKIVLIWLELLFSAVIVQLLIEFTGTFLQFKLVDFRLLYVILVGSVYGIKFGLIASFFASLSVLFSWYRLGFDWSLLIYNIENWLPFTLYFTAGAITGYVQDKKNNEIEYQNQQTKLIHEKYSFLYGVYSDINRIKDQFREQLLGYRDSFGRIYSVATELDTLQVEDIFLKALSILEDLMSSTSVAIYSLDDSKYYLRLEINSSSLKNKISKSLKLSDLPEMKNMIEIGEIFQNIEMLENYPAYSYPIMNNGNPVAVVVIWHAKFEQFTAYYLNLFKVICGLIQSSLVRAVLFADFTINLKYISGTKILQPDAFRDILEIKNSMKEKNIGEYQLLKVVQNTKNEVEMYLDIAKVIRSADYVGTLDDGEYYILLAQADEESVGNILARLLENEVESLPFDSDNIK